MNEPATAETPERWQPIPCYENFYQVSNRGRIRSLERIFTVYGVEARHEPESMLTPSKHHLGYHPINLVAPGQPASKRSCALVAEAFHSPRFEKAYVVHLDGNLAYMTPKKSVPTVIERGAGTQNQSHDQCKRGHAFAASNLKVYGGNRCCRGCNNTHSDLRRHPDEKRRLQ